MFAALFMLMPAVAALITGKATGEGMKLTGKGSLMLGIDFSNKKWIFFLIACLMPWIINEIGAAADMIIFDGFDRQMINSDVFAPYKEIVPLFPALSISSAVIGSFGGLGEELGWRTYMMPKLEKKTGIIPSVITGGIIWSAWHWPLIHHGHSFGIDYPGYPWAGPLAFTAFCIFENAFLTYLTKKTCSVWPAAFAHAVNNARPSILLFFLNKEKLPVIESTFGFVQFFPSVIVGAICVYLMIKDNRRVNNGTES
jgi:membrane protease YdiL (CAAX protease family)